MPLKKSSAVELAEELYKQRVDANEEQMRSFVATAVYRMEADFKVDNEAGDRMPVHQVVSLALKKNGLAVAPAGFVMLLNTGRIPRFKGENTSPFSTKHCAFAYSDEYGQLQFDQLTPELSANFIGNTVKSHSINPVTVPEYPTFAFVALPKSGFRGSNLVDFYYWDQLGTAENQDRANSGYWGDSVRAVMGLGVEGRSIRDCAEQLVTVSQGQILTFNENPPNYS